MFSNGITPDLEHLSANLPPGRIECPRSLLTAFHGRYDGNLWIFLHPHSLHPLHYSMPAFSGAQNFTINNSQLIDFVNNTGPSGIDILLEASYPGAAHDSSDRTYSSRCFPGTREQYIEDITHWAIPALGDTPTPIYWMKGPGGVGKSSIAQTCSEKFKDLEKLGAAFFFSINGPNKPEKFFPSIAHQLSTIHAPYRDLIDTKIRHNKTLVNKAMKFQFQYLIDAPLRELAAQGKGIKERIVVIIDGLDECGGADAQCDIIRIIAAGVVDGILPLCWAFFSRPEPHIEKMFAGINVASRCHKVFLPISRDADGEIGLYLRNGFENILQRRNTSIGTEWPSTRDMEILIGAADGLFIYASTILRFVDQLGFVGPQKRLHAIIDVILDRRNRNLDTQTTTPFAELDAFYTLILKRIPIEILPSVHLLLAGLCQWEAGGVILLANVLGLSKDEFETVCHHASAVVRLQVPGKDLSPALAFNTSSPFTQLNQHTQEQIFYAVQADLGGHVSFYHKSFRDFLLDPTRSNRFCARGSEALARHYLQQHLSYDQTYYWVGSELVLAPGASDCASSLAYPYTNELVNSIIKARAYSEVGDEDAQSLPSLGVLGKMGAHLDFRKRLYTHTRLMSVTVPHVWTGWHWGSACRIKIYPGTRIVWASMAKFDVHAFKMMIKTYQQGKIIRRYHHNLTSRIKSLFRDKPQQHSELGLYCIGHDEKSIFWYWEINYDLQHYREFRTTNFADGEKIFREEDFDSWPEWGWDL